MAGGSSLNFRNQWAPARHDGHTPRQAPWDASWLWSSPVKGDSTHQHIPRTWKTWPFVSMGCMVSYIWLHGESSVYHPTIWWCDCWGSLRIRKHDPWGSMSRSLTPVPCGPWEALTWRSGRTWWFSSVSGDFNTIWSTFAASGGFNNMGPSLLRGWVEGSPLRSAGDLFAISRDQ